MIKPAVDKNSSEFLATISQQISGAVGQDFLQNLVVEISKILSADYVFIGRIDDTNKIVQTLAMSIDQEAADNITYDLEDTPCENVSNKQLCCHKSGVASLYPKDVMLKDLEIEGYLGSPLYYANGDILGLIVALYKKPISNEALTSSLFENYGARISAEIERLDKDRELKTLNETLEQKVQQRTRMLEAMNLELESFIDTITHELKAPLRSIKGFSTVLNEDYAAKLPEDAQDYLQRIENNSVKMEKQIDALLKLSLVSHKEYVISQIDFSKIAKEAVADTLSTQDKEKFDITIEENIKTVADRGATYQLLTNIINNAIKYSKESEQPRIHIGRDEKGWLFVKDNGIGFTQEYADKMFQPFKRIQARADLAGTGIGMATCQRIVNKHGGQIKAEGSEDNGAIISFTFLPEHGE